MSSAGVDHLQKLPVELMETVGDYLEPADIIHLRCMSKDCQSKIEKLFAKTCFTHLNVLLCSDASIAKNIKALEFPPFSCHVRSVTVYIDQLAAGSVSAGPHGNHHMQLLTSFFKRLAVLAIETKLTVATRAQELVRRRGKKLSDAIVPPDFSKDAGFNTVVDAMHRSGYRPREFTINSAGAPTDETWYLPVHELVEAGRLPALIAVLANVKILSLDLWTQKGLEDSSDHFFASIATLRNLESLTIYGRDASDDSLEDELLGACELTIAEGLLKVQFPCLKTLRVWGCEIFESDLTPFLRSHRENYRLEKFVMRHAVFADLVFNGDLEQVNQISCEQLEELTGVEVAVFHANGG